MYRRDRPSRAAIAVAAVLLIVLLPKPALAYIGPGAGFALAGSFFAIFGAIFSALSMILFWPIRRIVRMIFRKRPPGKVRFRRIVILGLDGLDHGLTEKLLAEGKLPNLAKLREQGRFQSLAARCRRSRPSPGPRFKPA